MSSINDLITRVTDSPTGRPVIAKLNGSKALGASSITLTTATNWTTTTAVHIAIYTTTAAGYKDPTTQADYKGTLVGTTISNLLLTGGTDRAYGTDAYVEITPTARYAKDLYDWGIVQHNQDGTHGAITATSLATSGGISTGSFTATGSVSLPANSVAASAVAAGLLMTKISNNSLFTAYLNTTGTAAASTDTKVSFNAEDIDANAQFDVSNGRFTAPGGQFHFDAGVSVTVAAGDLYYVALYRNGVVWRRGTGNVSAGTAEMTYTVSADISLANGDYIEVYFHNGSTASKAISSGRDKTYFNGHLLGV